MAACEGQNKTHITVPVGNLISHCEELYVCWGTMKIAIEALHHDVLCTYVRTPKGTEIPRLDMGETALPLSRCDDAFDMP